MIVAKILQLLVIRELLKIFLGTKIKAKKVQGMEES